eukprot:922357-Pleurochrysis_carterae.AAC.1
MKDTQIRKMSIAQVCRTVSSTTLQPTEIPNARSILSSDTQKCVRKYTTVAGLYAIANVKPQGQVDYRVPYYRCPRPSAVQYGRQGRIFKDHARLGWRVLANLNLYRDLPRATIQRPDRAENHLIIYDTVKRGRGAGAGAGAGRTRGWLRGGGTVRLCRPCALRDART